MEFKVGDKVRIVDANEEYLMFRDFYEENRNEFTKEWISGKSASYGEVGYINTIARNSRHDEDVAIVNLDTRSHIIGLDGLEKIEDSIKLNLKIENIIKEEKYYINTNHGKFDITESVLEILNKQKR
jgi:hypothetical protein